MGPKSILVWEGGVEVKERRGVDDAVERYPKREEKGE